MSAKEFLEETFAIEIHDISHSKILSCQMKQNQVVSSIEAFIRRFHSFLKEYQSSINHLDPILTSASQYTTNVFTEISKSRSLLCNESWSSISRIEQQLLTLDHEKTSYCLSGYPTTSKNTLKPPPLVCNISEKN